MAGRSRFNIRWLLRAIVRLGLGALLLALSVLTLWAIRALRAPQARRAANIGVNRASVIAQQSLLPSCVNA